jgi:hypothetical protein
VSDGDTQTEARAIETAAPLEMADPAKNLILVALSQLLPRRSKRNARKMPRLSISELAASIARIGLLQNLIVIASADGEHYEVVAGDCRSTALKLLAKKHRILQAVGEYAPEQVSRLAKLKKANIASEAERLADSSGWMPAIFKVEGSQEATQEAPQEQDDAPEDAEAMANEPAVALAA